MLVKQGENPLLSYCSEARYWPELAGAAPLGIVYSAGLGVRSSQGAAAAVASAAFAAAMPPTAAARCEETVKAQRAPGWLLRRSTSWGGYCPRASAPFAAASG